MRLLLLTLAVVFSQPVCLTNAQKVLSSQRTVSLHLSQDNDPRDIWIRFAITGGFGGYSSFIATHPNTWNYDIPISYEGKLAKTLRLIVSSENYGTRIFDFPKLKKQKEIIELKLEPLGKSSVFGKSVIAGKNVNRKTSNRSKLHTKLGM
jgi:hypothetical protein